MKSPKLCASYKVDRLRGFLSFMILEKASIKNDFGNNSSAKGVILEKFVINLSASTELRWVCDQGYL